MTWLVVFCSLVFVLGLIAGIRLGMWLEERAAARDLAEERAEEEAGQYVGQLVEPPEVAHEWPASVPVLYGRRRPRDAREDPDLISRILAPAIAHEAWLAHEEQALALANDGWHDQCPRCSLCGSHRHAGPCEPETDEEFSARLARTADEIIAWAGEQAYLSGEHWKRP